ncbi:mesoderm induction early response protein 1 [Lasius niger]|uniref:Mesoderm induction early response protein 1 n=1 Tax=Lasius niger TaxID=67767 RepID=A0A0J7KR51_LASNI|nr:mesoderm induction early response protein 1 [Lasius niger]
MYVPYRADQDYDMGPATEMMVNDFDDERTLDEEEALEGSEDSHNELSNLQKEGDMPLKDLLAMYGYGEPSTENSNSSDHMLLPSGSGDPETEERYSDKGDNDADDDDDDDEVDAASNEPDLKQFYTEMLVKGKDKASSLSGSTMKSNSSGIVGSRKRRIDDDEDDEDEDAEAEECSLTGTRSGNGKKTRSSPTIVGANAVTCDGIVNLGGASVADSTIEEGSASGAIDGPEDRIVSAGIGSGSSRLLRSVSRPQSEEEEDDCDYSPDEEEWKKTIMVGTDYQAAIPEGLCRYDDALPYENEDKMLWDPSHISEEDTEEFLERAQLPAVKGGSLPAGSHIRDDEQALYLLLQCGYNLEEALRRRRMNVLPPTDAVRTRSVGELVQFYYLWKKTERHDIFTYKARLEKKKYALHPGITGLGWKRGRSLGRDQRSNAGATTATSTTTALGNVGRSYHVLVNVQFQRFNYTDILFIVDSSSRLSFVRIRLCEPASMERPSVSKSTYLLRHHDDNNQHYHSYYVYDNGYRPRLDKYSYY